MLYREFQPSPPLRGQVDCLWLLEQAPGPEAAPEKILPDGQVELIFNLAAPYRQLEPEETNTQPRSFVVGQIRRYLRIVPTGPVALLGIRLEPTAVHRWLGVPMHELTDTSVSLGDLGRAELVELEGRLHDTSSWAERIALAEQALMEWLPGGKGLVDDAVGWIRRTHGRFDLARVAERIGVSTRTLDRRFANEVGLAPKLFSRQVRFQRVFDLLARSPRPSWSEVALAGGCFDQAHLNREFKAFAGESPEAFLRGRHDLSDRLTGLVVED